MAKTGKGLLPPLHGLNEGRHIFRALQKSMKSSPYDVALKMTDLPIEINILMTASLAPP